jgi:hypothetical protein
MLNRKKSCAVDIGGREKFHIIKSSKPWGQTDLSKRVCKSALLIQHARKNQQHCTGSLRPPAATELVASAGRCAWLHLSLTTSLMQARLATYPRNSGSWMKAAEQKIRQGKDARTPSDPCSWPLELLSVWLWGISSCTATCRLPSGLQATSHGCTFQKCIASAAQSTET